MHDCDEHDSVAGGEVLAVLTEHPSRGAVCSQNCCAAPASERVRPFAKPCGGPRPMPHGRGPAATCSTGDEGAPPIEPALSPRPGTAPVPGGDLGEDGLPVALPSGPRSVGGPGDSGAGPTASKYSLTFAEGPAAETRREIPSSRNTTSFVAAMSYVDDRTPVTYDEEAVELPNVLVEISGKEQDAVRVPLQRQFMRSVEGEPVTPTVFMQYLSEQLGQNITAVYYPVRKSNRQSGGKTSTDLQAFAKDKMSGGSGMAYPFVGGMRIVVCVDGSDVLQSPAAKTAVPCVGCVVA